jgi:cobalt-zinc-cadmium efflux system protein
MPNTSKLPATAHLHAHHAGDAAHLHVTEHRSQQILGWSVGLTLCFAAVEVGAGFWANSLALISDAGHMITDASALALALMAQVLAKRPPSANNSFGFGRAEALAAFVNGLIMLAVIGWISVEAVARLRAPEPVAGAAVFVVALIGLIVNLGVAWLLSRDQKSLNTRAALVHVMGDLLGSVGALVAGLVIYYTGWLPIDPLLSIFVSLLLLKSTVSLLRDSYHFLMQGVPAQIDYVQVGADLAAIDGVLSVHDLHVWEMSPGQPALIGHVEVRELHDWPEVLGRIKDMLLQKHGIDHITMQAEPGENDAPYCANV